MPGGGGAAEVCEEAVYLALALRNVGQGIAVLHGWHLYPERRTGRDDHPPPEEFTRLTRDLYVPVGDIGFWQGTFRDPSSAEFAAVRSAIEARDGLTVDVLYGDHEGGQRVISRCGLLPRADGGWLATAARHWNIEGENPQ